MLQRFQSPHIDTSSTQSFLDLFHIAAENVGIHGIPKNISPSSASTATCPVAGSQRAEDSQGGTVREASPTPPPDQPAPKTQKSG
eukprot:10404545-Karenia_brevis.AAC.1